jgi:PAS domain S-box-containing protein
MNNNSTFPNVLRREAEAHLAHTAGTESELLSNKKLLHELQVHQVQLEMQNNELRRMQLALEDSRDQYADLYNHAPVGYLSLTHNGLIDTINLTALEILGAEYSKLQSRRFASLVAPKDGDSWHVFFAKVMKHSHRMSIELTLKASNDSEIIAQLDCVYINSILRITLIDLTKAKQVEAALHQAEKFALINAERMQTAKVHKRR